MSERSPYTEYAEIKFEAKFVKKNCNSCKFFENSACNRGIKFDPNADVIEVRSEGFVPSKTEPGLDDWDKGVYKIKDCPSKKRKSRFRLPKKK